MEKYNYLTAVTVDVTDYIKNEINLDEYETADELKDELNERLFVNDSVTGNASGSYTFNIWKAEENLCHNLDLLGEALTEFGCDSDYMAKKGAEACDVTIRCYLLAQAVDSAVDALDYEFKSDNYRRRLNA